MSYYMYYRWGDGQRDATVAQMREALAQLDADDTEHPGVSLQHESEWSLGAYPGGLLVWENVADDGQPRHMNGVSRQRVLELWQKLAAGQLDEIDAEPWLAGYEDD